ncbi:hypothetical protein, partial [Levilinea saccharolytica]|uniref:hypothetical protein n=1 Tax=Levilinea saccharolytica TaxID=229921 RepID=UPI001F17E0FD
TIALASHSIVKERWIFLTRIYRKKVALSDSNLQKKGCTINMRGSNIIRTFLFYNRIGEENLAVV